MRSDDFAVAKTPNVKPSCTVIATQPSASVTHIDSKWMFARAFTSD